MILILILIFWLLFTYNQNGVYLALPLTIAIINVGFSTFLLVFSPDSYKLKIIRIICILHIGIVIMIQIKPFVDYLIQWL